MSQQPVIAVIGDGWGALAAAGFLAHSGAEVRWIAGTGSRMIAPLSTLEVGAGLMAWKSLADRLGVACGPIETGSFLREFRNKSFREPAWTKAPTMAMRREVRDEVLWEAERTLAAPFEGRFELPLGELEEQLRAQVIALPNVKRVEGVPVAGFHFAGESVRSVLLASGEEIFCAGVIYADRWSSLSGLEGLPKAMAFTRGRDSVGALQAVFTHSTPVAPFVKEAFYGLLHKEAGEEMQRHVWGYFLNEGQKSVWTLLMAGEEVENNHEIAKKLRRMKQALERIFAGTDWLPAGVTEFQATVKSEQVRFEEHMIYSSGEVPSEPITVPKAPGISFVTDGYGPGSAFHQVALLLGTDLGIALEVDSALTLQEPAVATPAPQVDA